MAKVSIKNIFKKYENYEALQDISLEVKDKEFLVLVGPSGCGKSTLLRLVAGLEEITSGDLSIGDTLVNNVEPKDRNIAMVFQSYALYPHKNVYDNLAFGLKMRKFKKDEIERRVKKASEILHITEYLHRKPKQLSGGQRQRVALGRAIVRDPDVFLMDEPLSNLDAKLRVQMRTELINLHKDLQATILYVTHDQVEAMTMGDRIAILNDKKLQQVDTPANIYNNPCNMFVAGFIGSPPMNFIEGVIDENNDFIIANIRFKLNDALYKIVKDNQLFNKKVVLGIRPEHFNLCAKEESSISLQVSFVEMLGSENLLYLDMNGNKIVAKVLPEEMTPGEQSVSFIINLDKALLFDLETQQRIL